MAEPHLMSGTVSPSNLCYSHHTTLSLYRLMYTFNLISLPPNQSKKECTGCNKGLNRTLLGLVNYGFASFRSRKPGRRVSWERKSNECILIARQTAAEYMKEARSPERKSSSMTSKRRGGWNQEKGWILEGSEMKRGEDQTSSLGDR